MIKLKSLLTENRLRDLEKSEVAHVNKAFERLVKGISKSWDIETDYPIYNRNDGTRYFRLIARWGQHIVQVEFELSSLPSHVKATQINVSANEYVTLGGKEVMNTTWKIKVEDDTDLVKLFKKESKIKSNVKKVIKKIEKLSDKESDAMTKYYKSIGGVPVSD